MLAKTKENHTFTADSYSVITSDEYNITLGLLNRTRTVIERHNWLELVLATEGVSPTIDPINDRKL